MNGQVDNAPWWLAAIVLGGTMIFFYGRSKGWWGDQ